MRFISELIGFGITVSLLIIGAKVVINTLGKWARAYNAQEHRDHRDQ
jgi:hypothetical protein